MSNLAGIAERMRSVGKQENEFLGRFAAEILFDRPILLDGVLADLERCCARAPDGGGGAESALGRGNYLD